MKIKNIIDYLEEWAPRNFQEEWDNSGLPIGNPQDPVMGVFVALDLEDGVIEEAKKRGANLIINHHPILFHSIKSLNFKDPRTLLIKKCLEYGITVYAAHTNLDKVQGGVSDALAEMLDLELPFIMDVQGEEVGYGRYGDLEAHVSLSSLLSFIGDSMSLNGAILYGSLEQKIKRIGLVGGSGSDFVEKAINEKIDLLITSEIDHYESRLADQAGLAILDIGHYNSEFPVTFSIKEYLDSIGIGCPVFIVDIPQARKTLKLGI